MNLRGAVNELTNVICGMTAIVVLAVTGDIWWALGFIFFLYRWGVRRTENDNADKLKEKETRNED